MLTLFHSLLDNHLHGNPCQKSSKIVLAGESPILLPADGHRSCQPVSAGVRRCSNRSKIRSVQRCYLSGTFCYPCVRAGPPRIVAGHSIVTKMLRGCRLYEQSTKFVASRWMPGLFPDQVV